MATRQKADTKALKQLRKDISKAAKPALKEVRGRAEELLAEAAPRGRTKKLAKGVRHQEKLSGSVLESRIFFAAVNQNKGGAATVHLPSGRTKKIKLRAGEPYDYAEGVIRGTGVYGPRAQMIEPVRSKVLLVGVDDVEAGESYIVGPRGQKYVVRLRSKGTRPNPFHEPAADRLELEAPEIVTAVLAREGVTL